ncbi:MAG: hypothetical protein ACKOAU_00835 [Pirellula sp.]
MKIMAKFPICERLSRSMLCTQVLRLLTLLIVLSSNDGLRAQEQPPQESQVRDLLESKSTEPVVAEAPAIPRSKEPLRVARLETPNTSVSGIGTGTTPEDATEGRLPTAIPLPFGPDREAGWSVKTKHWVAPAYCHQPTYYEDVMLEHHGHERCPPLQPLLSGARFYSGIFFTPYLAYLRPPLQDIPNTGHYRPGSCAPGVRQRAPYDPGAIKVQTAAVATGVLALQP